MIRTAEAIQPTLEKSVDFDLPMKKLQASRLASLTGLPVEQLENRTLSQLSEKLKWHIDPTLLMFRQICGQVVKRDPATGQEFGVPYATVHVYDTDCSLLGFFPPQSPWSWIFPFHYHREELNSIVTDSCGRFCMFIPRWHIEYILRFMKTRICLPKMLVRPTIRELLEELNPIPEHIDNLQSPSSGNADDAPFFFTNGGKVKIEEAEHVLGSTVTNKLLAMEMSSDFGNATEERINLLNHKATPVVPLPPPFPPEFRVKHNGHPVADREKMMHAVRDTLSERLHIPRKELETFHLDHHHGPFWRRCFPVYLFEWIQIRDVPDITFSVTQDVNGDGKQETIYSEGLFDVRWNAGAISDVILEASQNAISSPICDVPPVTASKIATIEFAGLMPLDSTYHDSSSGYAVRPNRPHSSGLWTCPVSVMDLATAPYTGVLDLFGVSQVAGASFYRVVYKRSASDPFTPMKGLTWPLYKYVGGLLQEHWAASDANGWYQILPDADQWFPENLLIAWPTKNFKDGLYTVKVEVADAAKAPISTGQSKEVSFVIDNSFPTVTFNSPSTPLGWRVAGSPTTNWITGPCAIIKRPTNNGVPVDIEVVVAYSVAAQHLRSAKMYASGCGSGNPVLASLPETAEHWYTDFDDNYVMKTATYTVPGTRPPGAYTFSVNAASRAFNPSDPTGHVPDWYYDPVFNYRHPSFAVTIVNG